MTDAAPEAVDITTRELVTLLVTLRGEMVRLNERMEQLEKDNEDLLQAWRTGAGVVRMFKVVAIVAGAIGATIAVVRELFR